MSETRALTGTRQLAKDFTPGNFSELQGQLTINAIASDYQFTNPAATLEGFYAESYFDMSGYTRDYLTTFPTQGFIQEAGRWQVENSPNVRLLVLDLMMADRIDDPNSLRNAIVVNNSEIPGFKTSTNEWDQVIFGRFREFLPVSQGAAVSDVYVPVSDQQFGSLGATTADKIWIYKFIIVVGLIEGIGSTIRCPASRAVLDINVEQEPTDAYMMRQKRSYELDNYPTL